MRVSCTYVRVRLPNAKRGEGNWGYQLLHLAMVSASIYVSAAPQRQSKHNGAPSAGSRRLYPPAAYEFNNDLAVLDER